jgi:hypothetical protein
MFLLLSYYNLVTGIEIYYNSEKKRVRNTEGGVGRGLNSFVTDSC